MGKVKSFVKKRKEKKGEMVKEFFICTIILILIFVGNGITQGYSRNSIEDINQKLVDLREEMNKVGGQEVLFPVIMPKEMW